MKKAYWIKCGADAWTEVTPKNGKDFSLEELQDFIRDNKDDMVEIVPLPSGNLLVVNEEGKLIGLQNNESATELWKKEYPIDKYPNNNDELIVGNCLICPNNMIK